MDGVLIDSERAVNRAWEIVGARYGLKNVIDTVNRCKGCNRETNRRIFKEAYGQDFPYEARSAESKEIFVKMMANGEITLKDGVEETLVSLKNKGIKIALATSTSEEIALPELESYGILHFFDVKVCGNQVKKSKPDPEIFLLAAEKLGFSVDRVMVVEDSYKGVLAGKNASMFTVMVPDTLPPNELMQEKADIIIDSLPLLMNEMFE